MLDETAEVVITAVIDAPRPVRDDLLTIWCERHPDTASADLLALARRTDDRSHRKLAEAYARKVRPATGRRLQALPYTRRISS
jgi:hypothetical protein